VKKHRIVSVVGTRPEVIKMAPIVRQLEKERSIESLVLASGQHRDILDKSLDFFKIVPDFDLNVMTPGQTLEGLTSRILLKSSEWFRKVKPDLVIVQGDTTTVLAVSLACFYLNIPVAHVEAGLRTNDMRNPFPEEANRIITTRLATFHFAPTALAFENLMREGIDPKQALLSGNTVVDSLKWTLGKTHLIKSNPETSHQILVTCHRRENFGSNLQEILSAVSTLAKQNSDYRFLFPVHPNPEVGYSVRRSLGTLSNVILTEPLGYQSFIEAMRDSHLILTDSGGVQEEAPTLGVPVLVLRSHTERPEAIMSGSAKLVGSSAKNIVSETQNLIDDLGAWKSMSNRPSPFGDGTAAEKITKFLVERLERISASAPE